MQVYADESKFNETVKSYSLDRLGLKEQNCNVLTAGVPMIQLAVRIGLLRIPKEENIKSR